MRANCKDIIKSVLKTVMLIYMGYASLAGIPFLSDKGNARVVMSVLTIFVFLLIYQKRYIKSLKKYTTVFFDKYIVALAVVLIIHGVYGARKYEQSFFDMYIVLIEYILLLLVYPILMWLDSDERGFWKFVKFSGGLLSFIIMVQAYFENYFGISVVQTIHGAVRNGRIRIITPAICSILVIYVFYSILNERKKRIGNMFLFGVLMITLIWVDQTRMMIVSVMCGLGACVLTRRRKHVLRTLIVYFVFVLIIAIALNTGMIEAFLKSFASNSKEGLSTSVRFEAIEYFWKFFRNNPLLGMGYIRPTTPELISIWSGPFKKFYLNDLGVIGLLCRTGLTSIVIYGVPLVRMFDVGFKNLKFKSIKGSLLIGLSVYMAVTSISLIYTDQERLLWFGMLIAIFEFYNLKTIERNE